MQEYENNHFEETNKEPQDTKKVNEEKTVEQHTTSQTEAMASEQCAKDVEPVSQMEDTGDQRAEENDFSQQATAESENSTMDEEPKEQAEQIHTEANQEETSKEEPKQADSKGKKKKEKKHRTSSFIKQHRTGVTVASCFLLAGIGGFGGTLAANQLSGAGNVVMYQSVNKNSSGSSNSANTTTMSVKDVANQTMNSVVEIKTESVETGNFYQQAVTSGAGSGVILSADGYIVTNNHVIDGASKVSVTTKDGKEYEATLVGTDAATDLAVIKINATGLTPAVMGTSANLEVGDTAIAIGNPLGELGGTVTNGIISALDREITIDGQSMHLLQTNAAINPGNSGGGLFNDQGELIGIVNAKSSGDSIEGLGFAIPIDKAKTIIDSLIENGKVEGRPELGVTLQTVSKQSSNPFAQQSGDNKTYVCIVDVQSGKAADNAGLQKGDLILQVDGKDIEDVSSLKTLISSHTAGDKITMKIERNNKEMEVQVTLLEVSTSTTQKTSFSNGTNS